MRLGASLNFQDKECLCMLEVFFRKLLHSLEKDSLFVGPVVFRGLGMAG